MTDVTVHQQASLHHKQGKSSRNVAFLLKHSCPYIEKQVLLYFMGILKGELK